MAEIGADGVNGDTFDGLPRPYRTASDETGHPLALEPEGSPRADEALMWNSQSWGYWKYPFAPMVSKLKWLEPRHMINVCDRWARDKTDNLQATFFNGVGYESWENIWGIWNQMTPRDAEALRRVARIERAFADMLVSRDWEPYTPTLQYGVLRRVFLAQAAPSGRWSTATNMTSPANRSGCLTRSPRATTDLWNGVELTPRIPAGNAVLSFPMEAKGFGAILSVASGGPTQGLDATLTRTRQSASVPPPQPLA